MAMKVKDAMSGHPRCIDCNKTAHDAAKIMAEDNVGALPVYEGNHDNLVGMLTDRDIVVRCIGRDLDHRHCKVRDIMSRGLHTLNEDDDLDRALNIMKEQEVRRLVVMDKQHHHSGMLSLTDICNKVRNNDEMALKAVRAMPQAM